MPLCFARFALVFQSGREEAVNRLTAPQGHSRRSGEERRQERFSRGERSKEAVEAFLRSVLTACWLLGVFVNIFDVAPQSCAVVCGVANCIGMTQGRPLPAPPTPHKYCAPWNSENAPRRARACLLPVREGVLSPILTTYLIGGGIAFGGHGSSASGSDAGGGGDSGWWQ